MTTDISSPAVLPASLAATRRRHGGWWKILLVGIALWAASVVVTGVTLNVNLVPTIILIGSFLVPFVVTVFATERTINVTAIRFLLAFAVGGVCGVLGASLLEYQLMSSALLFVLVGAIEEGVKLVVLVIIGWSVHPKTARQGALLGAVVGAGFSAFESAGYAFSSAIAGRGISLTNLVETELVRAFLSPLGHILWTAILGAVLFGVAAKTGRLRWSWAIPVAFVGVALLHALWDSAGALGELIARAILGAPAPTAFGSLTPDDGALSGLTLGFFIGLLAVTAIVGILALVLSLRHFRSRTVDSLAESDGLVAPRTL